MLMRIALQWFALLMLAINVAAAPESHTKVDLLLPVETARAGDTVLAGVRLRMDPKWHTYWRSPGDAGGATEIEWQLPSGVTAGDIQWPAPERYNAEGLTTFVYHDEVVLLVPLKLDSSLAPGPIELKAKVSWLECEELCLPGKTDVSATLNIGDASKPSAQVALLDAAQKLIPATTGPAGLMADWESPAVEQKRFLLFEWPSNGATDPDFFPYASDDYEVSFTPEKLPVDVSRNAFRLEVKSTSGKWPAAIRGVIVQTLNGTRQAFEVALTPGATQTKSRGATGVTTPTAEQPTSAAKFLVFALLGGLILNLMPCVLPILSLKVLHIVNQRGAPASHARKHALVYLLGVLVSFWVLAGLVMAGRLASWGEQFQDPRFVVVMTVLMTLVGLNLFGVFEVILPGAAASKASELTAKEGVSGSFFTGALSVVLGASCVAPLLAGAIGWAITQTPFVIFVAFSLIGVGLALPFVLLSFFPALQIMLPKPGAWMEKFKIAMGFPMLATAAWLLSQTADHFGSRGPLWVGLFLVLLGLAAWIFGEFHQRGRRARGTSLLIALVILGGGYVWALERELDWRNPPTDAPGAATSNHNSSANGIAWQPWSSDAVAKARAEGRPVLVDFTANWCLTCQLNKKTSLEIDSVRKKLKEINAVALLGDYTRKNPDITEELKRFKQAGVPLVLVYPKDATKPPQILPTLLTPEIVLNALDEAAR
jgi:thiol:disulfide interchange protein